MTSPVDRELIPRASGLDAGVVTRWLLLGGAAVATAVVAVGWRYTVWIWAGSLAGLCILLLQDIVRMRRSHELSAAPDPNA